MSSRCRFVTPEVVRLPISDGDFIDVWKQLNAGEQQEVFGRMVAKGVVTIGEKIQLDPVLIGRTKLVAYIVGWSLVDQDGKPVPVSEAAIRTLEQDTYREIVQAIDAHEEASEKERTERKNVLAGEKESKHDLPSVA